MKPPRNLGARPARLAGPTSSGPLQLEHLSDEEGWAVLENGRQVNPFIRTAAAMAFYLCREGLTSRIENLDELPPALRDIATGVRKSELHR
ncbi:hypothetical protein [Hymenobacter pini]|uniref:hypothetical protein n=1 Tax=Hymenobacter pini TaxID=2880879 RepID=UPI001CF14AB9|nr:hypothetical protein [Hymenobacter pini]MCA8830546.1 hypothetical protein [Hymenobacter pini]